MVAIKTKRRTYGVDLKGNIAKRLNSEFFETEIHKGRLISDMIPMPDCVATFYVWAKTNPAALEKRWGCGNIQINDRTRDGDSDIL